MWFTAFREDCVSGEQLQAFLRDRRFQEKLKGKFYRKGSGGTNNGIAKAMAMRVVQYQPFNAETCICDKRVGVLVPRTYTIQNQTIHPLLFCF
ncbi:hypothetical protein QVD17_23785 [Tagetes erecta]|uniref:Uncharacterized protein n=1 Tax=Tagetes erecta TaxID=13708 RepID=A0AAD8KEH4_TARER|nr:hypothetical protein QVD17_23785 [Tagetes erecta]